MNFRAFVFILLNTKHLYLKNLEFTALLKTVLILFFVNTFIS